MTITTTQAKDFSAYARNPDTWILASRRNLAVTELLMDYLNILDTATERDFYQFSGCYYASYFHAGLAIENAAKAVLISHDPSIVNKSNLDIKKFGNRKGHALLDPVQSILGELSDYERRFLTKLEEFVWAGRYTVPTKADVLYDKKKMSIMRTSVSNERVMLRGLIERLCKKVKR
jgi:hypothetical protein